jgi:SAM-dependent methyltransferase
VSTDPITDDLAGLLERAVAGRGFSAYDGEQAPEHERLRRAIVELVEAALAAGAPAEAIAGLRDRIAHHLGDEQVLATFYDGVNAPRADHDGRWKGIVEDVNARFRGAGAVSLELGTWTAWPEERARNVEWDLGMADLIRLDFEPTYELDVVADARRLPFADASLDRIHGDSVLEHIPHPHDVLRECFRVLRPGGALFLITPFAFNLHGYPDDYLRYTPSWYEQMCREVGFTTVAADVGEAQGLYYTLHNSAKTARVEPDHAAAPALRTLHLLVIELLGLLVPFDRLFEGESRHWFTAVQCAAIKDGPFVPRGRERRPEVPFLDRNFDLLADPVSKAPLRREGDRLVCDENGLRYPVVDGVPHFTRPQQLRRTGGALRALKRRLPVG